IKAHLYLPTLHTRRRISRICLFQKIFYHHPHLRQSLLLDPHRSSRRLFNSLSVRRIPGSTVTFNNSFFPLAIIEWNNLPDHIVHISDPDLFKHAVSSLIIV
ncbi:unnamed protein product, partial [Ixodes hexagonus]